MIRHAALVPFLLVAACTGRSDVTPPPAPTAELTGMVTDPQRIALGPGARITVRLVDVSLADAPAVVLGERVIEANGRQVPFPFVIAYDPAAIVPNHTYAVQARIEEDGALRFISDRHYPVLTRGAPSTAELVLIPVQR